ncbi:MAG: pyrroline-5-carboxylate reductase [Alphaproteobacteria bacterium]|nr:pyrroline-5-carboxylate reductase [Alphaproteobacteria bacterium]
MGGALARRWQDKNLCQKLVIVDPAASPLKSFADIPRNFTPDVIVFAVKPQALAGMIDDYAAYPDALVITIAAGKPAAFFERRLGTDTKVVRAMPNTPAAIGKGITVACANQNVTPAEKDRAAKLLGAVGDVLWAENESLLNPVTALSGSGPAYVFLLIETLAQAGANIGLPRDMAEKLARQTVIGAASLAEIDAATPAEILRRNVTSPGGTTEAALKVLMSDSGIQDLFNRALKAATRRAEDLSR